MPDQHEQLDIHEELDDRTFGEWVEQLPGATWSMTIYGRLPQPLEPDDQDDHE